MSHRMARTARLLTLLALLASGAHAQSTTPAAPTARPAPAPSATATALDTALTRARAASLRIEHCPPVNCTRANGIGTAFYISTTGLALTAYHVVFGAPALSAVTPDGQRYPVKVVGYDETVDLALLQIGAKSATPALPIASAAPGVGERVGAIGNGGGARFRRVSGSLTALDARALRGDFPDRTLELRANLIPGDSGSAIVNARGEVVGVTSYIRTDGERIVSYAVPITARDPKLAELRAGVQRDAPVVGVRTAGDLTDRAFTLGLGGQRGAVFTDVQPGSPAARAGLRPVEVAAQSQSGEITRLKGDVVLAVNATRVQNFEEFINAVRALKVGDTVTLKLLRDGQPLSVQLKLAGHAQVFGSDEN
ncbi:S1C family serine protease [Deinococcus maricopensis]|uniref:Peptidase S1 and S6 chymotrypsin/Hap n=1 Tax=Deinococcus maricopensis (strain DSM 21211 / LMG 22137 / NRRL B-23946 / LB-34) TaxID=709986 RepID=E8U4H8_DEIML|nr:S1C family serine protease [Deinococcus maricopensis]ADV68843.1 peptidase S1 and S6 chymotrypsin/Hap [Deinococcus maricopensis DSM 21211]